MLIVLDSLKSVNSILELCAYEQVRKCANPFIQPLGNKIFLRIISVIILQRGTDKLNL